MRYSLEISAWSGGEATGMQRGPHAKKEQRTRVLGLGGRVILSIVLEVFIKILLVSHLDKVHVLLRSVASVLS